MKKVLVLLLVVLMMFSSTALAYNVSEPGVIPVVDEVVEYTIVAPDTTYVNDLNENTLTSWIAEKTNVQLVFQEIPDTEWDTKVNLLIASDELPDAFIYGGFTAAELADYGSQGVFMAMNDIIEEHGYYTKQVFEQQDKLPGAYTALDGKMYTLPDINECYHCFYSMRAWINQTWLDNLGLEYPNTLEELCEVLRAFKEQDANGNGDPNDEIPMDFNGGFNSPYGLSQLLGSTGLQITDPYPTGYFAEDGEVKNIYVDERFKRTVQFAQELWSLGLINEEAITQDYSKFQSLARGEGTTAKVGFTWGWERGDRFGNELMDQYVSVPQLKETPDTEKICYAYDFYFLNYDGNRVAMSANCQNKEAAMKFIDGFYDEKVSLEVLFGGANETDGCISVGDDGSYTVLPPADSSIDPGTWKWTNSFADNGPIWVRDGLNITLGTDMQAVGEEKSVYDELFENLDPKDIYPQSFMKYSEADTNTLAMNQANINNLTDQTWSAWVTDSSRDIDAEWDSFVQSLMSSGLSQNLEIRQAAFDQYLETMA